MFYYLRKVKGQMNAKIKKICAMYRNVLELILRVKRDW